MTSDTESVTHSTSTADEFKLAVKEWVMINDQISDYRKVIAERNKRKKELTQFIILFMQESNKEICNLGENGILHMKTQKSQATLTKDHLLKWTTEFYNEDTSKATALTQFLLEKKKQESSEKQVLKRSNVII